MNNSEQNPQSCQTDVSSGYSYAIARLKAGSSFYGNCEVCGKQVDTAYFQDEYKAYKKSDGTISRTQYGCRSLFGHESCLIKCRR